MERPEIHAELQRKLVSYQPSGKTKRLVRATPKLFLVGIAGAGKDTIIRELIKTGEYQPIVSHTTRQPRANNGVMEREDVEYHFIDLARAEAMIDAGEYIEAKQYGGNIYGTTAAELQRAYDNHKIAVTDIEVQGIEAYILLDPKTHAVFVLPPSFEIWQQRLIGRYGEQLNHEDLAKRMATALQELEHALHADYFSFVVNDDLPEAVTEVQRIVNGKEAMKHKTAARGLAAKLSQELKAHLAWSSRSL